MDVKAVTPTRTTSSKQGRDSAPTLFVPRGVLQVRSMACCLLIPRTLSYDLLHYDNTLSHFTITGGYKLYRIAHHNRSTGAGYTH